MIDFQKIFSLGQGYATQLNGNIDNPFWKELLQIWAYFCKCFKVESVFQILNSPLWFNSNLTNGDYFYIKDWYNKGLRHVSDLINEHGNFYEFDAVKTRYNLRGTFWDFQSLLRKSPNEWKTILNHNKVSCILNRYNVTCSTYVQRLIADKKGCRRFYDIMTAANTFILTNKWERETAGITERECTDYFSVIRLLKEVKLKDFHYKVTNKILLTKSFLYRINKIDNDLCEYCHQQPETICHLFVECEDVKRFWTFLNEWLRINSNLSLNLEEKIFYLLTKININ